tara:strand:+ start:733 stop:1341 length:609 start_codon:yes stop_codon:yes gene_type:complete
MKYNKTFAEALKQVREDGHTDVASAIRSCKTTIEDASQMLSKLQMMNPEGDLPSWWMKKIAIASDSMNKLRDYLLVPSVTEQDERSFEKDTKSGKSSNVIIGTLEKENERLIGQINLLKQKLENEKNRTVKPEPNPDTGEVPLRTGLAQALLDKKDKNKPELKGTDKKKLKMSLGKSKVDVNPDVDLGIYSGGQKTPNGNLH